MTHSWTEEVVEKVARAIFDPERVGNPLNWERQPEWQRELKRTQAQAALSIPEIAALYEALEDLSEEVIRMCGVINPERRLGKSLTKARKALTLCRKGTE